MEHSIFLFSFFFVFQTVIYTIIYEINYFVKFLERFVISFRNSSSRTDDRFVMPPFLPFPINRPIHRGGGGGIDRLLSTSSFVTAFKWFWYLLVALPEKTPDICHRWLNDHFTILFGYNLFSSSSISNKVYLNFELRCLIDVRK